MAVNTPSGEVLWQKTSKYMPLTMAVKRCRTAFRNRTQYGNRHDVGLRLALVLVGK